MSSLSILIPARNEEFLSKTVDNILENIEGDTDIIVALDGEWANPPLRQHEKITVIKFPKSIGQRAATNQACRLSKAKYVMKVDAHCAFDKGFDVKMMSEMQDDWTMVPTMYNLYGFDWVCETGHRRYQGPSGNCLECGKATVKDVVWRPKPSPKNNFFTFDKTLHFQYWKGFEKRPEGQGDICETMSIQGSCFMMTREKYWELDICSERFNSWGQQGVEVSCKTWMSGGKVMVNKKTWYAHMFRTQGKDFAFPYHNPEQQIEENRKMSRELFLNNKWEKAKLPFESILERFHPVPRWHNGVVYYTDNQLDPEIMEACQRQLRKAFDGEIVSVSLKPIDFGRNIVLPLERGYLTMAKQILAGLEAIDREIVFFCEHDVLYHPSHFDFVPEKGGIYYYNQNVWKIRSSDGHALQYDCNQLSGLCAYRVTLIKHFRERVRRIEKEGYSTKMGFEPGTHNRPERIDDLKCQSWRSEYPNLDIRHDKNLTSSRWSKEEFRNQSNTAGWKEADEIEGWGVIKGRFKELLSQT